jgi:hypothetical protein
LMEMAMRKFIRGKSWAWQEGGKWIGAADARERSLSYWHAT